MRNILVCSLQDKLAGQIPKRKTLKASKRTRGHIINYEKKCRGKEGKKNKEREAQGSSISKQIWCVDFSVLEGTDVGDDVV